jgi:hypothetical protein
MAEWLMQTGIWSDLNQTLGTLFAHYEEEWLRPEHAPEAIARLDALRSGLAQSGSAALHRFSISRNAEGVHTYCEFRNAEIISELTSLIAFVEQAAADRLSLYCSL